MKPTIKSHRCLKAFTTGIGAILPALASVNHLVCIVALVLAFSDRPARAALTASEQQALAHRFRPYIKTTLDEGRDEPFHPCNWQWFIARADLYGSVLAPAMLTHQMMAGNPQTLLQPPHSDARTDGVVDPGYTLYLAAAQHRAGEPWTDVVASGHGIYAHVEEVNDKIVNIEYTILWAYNAAIGSNHDGDITTITVVYDRGCDLLTRVTYLMHGAVIATFRIASPSSTSLVDLPGLDQNFAAQTKKAAKLFLSATDQYQDGPWWHSPSAPFLFLVQDPISLRFEHPVVYAEEGSHEPWPNRAGTATTAPAHDGDGFSFLPDTVQVLGTLNEPNPAHAPFLYYNGKFGTDPTGIIFHRAWFWPEGRANNPYHIPDSRFTDRDPYTQNGNLPWPPPPEHTGGPVTVYADSHAGVNFDGSLASPFPDPTTANSFVPSGGTVSLAAGTYPGRVVLSRPCKLVSRGGSATIGGP